MRSGLDTDFVAPDIRPQDDLFRHVNGRWLEETEIPPDRAVHGTFHRLRDEAELHVREIVERCAAGDAPEGSNPRKIGDLYAAFMDEERVERLGSSPIAADLDRVAAARDRSELLRTMGELARVGVPGAFGAWVDSDARDSEHYAVYLNQGGLGLPDESYYRDDGFAAIRDEYVAHVGRMLALAGLPDPQVRAQRVFALESRLAGSHWDRVADRDAVKTYTKVDGGQLAALAPAFDWATWVDGLGVDPAALATVVVRQPGYLTGLSRALEEVPIEDWRSWLAWRTVRSAAPLLASAFVAESFAFYGTTLTGAPQLRERWKRGVGLVEGALGEALAEIYVQEHFPPAARERMVALVANLEEAYRRSITGLDWMGPETKRRALEKLSRFTPKIGYPDRWKDYSALSVSRDDLVGNARRSAVVELERDMAKLGGPVDRSEWFMTPQTVNAYYNPSMNEIVFPAAILQPPFFDADADDAANYGAIGAVIGHEIGHGFDDQGSRYDGDGNLQDWWTDEDRAEFETRTQRLVAQYDALSPQQAPGHFVNGALTVGENIGDLGGLSIAYAAYRLAHDGEEPPEIDGRTGDARFFFSWAQAWRTKARDAEVIRRLTLDPHSPDEFRCNAVVRNIDAFHAAYETKPGDGLWLEPPDRVRIW